MSTTERRKYTLEEKQDYVRRVKDLIAGGMSVQQAVDSVGINHGNYHRWASGKSMGKLGGNRPAKKAKPMLVNIPVDGPSPTHAGRMISVDRRVIVDLIDRLVSLL